MDHSYRRNIILRAYAEVQRADFGAGREPQQTGPWKQDRASQTIYNAGTAEAGGFTDRAVQDYAYVVRTNSEHEEKGRVLPESFLRPGDVIKVYERVF